MKTLNLTEIELDLVSIALNRINRNMERTGISRYELSDIDLILNYKELKGLQSAATKAHDLNMSKWE